MDGTLSLREAAERLQVSIADLWSAAQEGSLPAQRVLVDGREVWRFESQALDGWAKGTHSNAHLKALEMLENSQQEVTRLQRQLLQAQFLASQGQRLLAEHSESHHEQRAQLAQERARAQELDEELTVAREELARWESFRQRPWWRRVFRSA